MTREFRATFVHENGWWIGWTDDFRGAHAQERTLDEARASLKEAIVGLLEIESEIGTPGSETADADEVIRETVVVDAA